MAPTICCRDVSHKLHRRQQKQQMPIDASSTATPAPENEENMTTGSGGGMSVAASGRSRMVMKNNPRAAKNAAIRRRRRRGVVWLLHEIEDARISTTTENSAVSSATKEYQERHNADSSAEEFDGSGMEEEVDSRVGRLSEPLEGHKRPGGLLGITMRTVELIRRNQLLQWRLSMLQEETRAFVKSVMNNPENRRVEEGKNKEAKDNLSDAAQDPSVSGSC